MRISFDNVQPIEFKWHKASRGYYMEDQGIGIHRKARALSSVAAEHGIAHLQDSMYGMVTGPFLIEVPGGETIEYQPLEDNTMLFLEFADVDLNDWGGESITAFVNEYGPLTEDVFVSKLLDEEALSNISPAEIMERMTEGVFGTGDSLNYFQQEIREMSLITQVLESWKEINRKSLHALRSYEVGSDWIDFQFVDGAFHVGKWRDFDSSAFIRNRIEGAFLTINDVYESKRDIFLAAQTMLTVWENAKLGELVIKPQLSQDDKGEIRPYLVPENLLTAMWVQLYQATVGETRFKRCAICGEPEDVTDRNANWNYHTRCYNAQKQREYRENLRRNNAAAKETGSKKG